MNVKEIIREYLKANGYDGLVTDAGTPENRRCACSRRDTLCFCEDHAKDQQDESVFPKCKPAYWNQTKRCFCETKPVEEK